MKFKLRPNETVEWRSKKGAGFWARWFGILVACVGFFVLLQTTAFNDWGWLTWLGLIITVVGTVVISSMFIKGKAVEYRLTNQRIVVTRFGRITKEVSLKLFEGKPVSQFMEKYSAYMASGEQRYTLTLLHPTTLDKILHCRDVNPAAIKILEKIGHIVKCRYCQTTNSIFNARCVHCGGPL